MVHYVVTAAHRYTIDRFLTMWAERSAWRVRVIPYERLRHQRSFTGGTYVFTDMERVDGPTRRWATFVAERLRAEGNRVLNDPARVLPRYELLRVLHDTGRNDFTAYREAEWARLKYPAFLRLASDHTGSLTPILNGPEELAAAAKALPAGVRRDDVIAVEFVDTRDASGLFRKYSVHRVGPHFVPRHVFSTRDWVGKHADVTGPDEVAAETAFVAANPFDAEVRAAFDLAGVDYGRIDFGVLNGRVQVWEINTNATLSPGMERIEPARFGTLQQSSRAIVAAFEELDEHRGCDCRISPSRADRAAFGMTRRRLVLGTAGRLWRKSRTTAAGKAVARWWDEYG